MLNKIQTWFEVKLQAFPEEQVPNRSVELAAAVLMLEVARADHNQDPQELKQIISALEEAFDMDDGDIEEILEFAHETVDETVSLHAYIRELNEELSHEQKICLVEQLWKVAYADGRVDKYEDHTIRKLSDLLYVAHRDFIMAKHKAEQAVLRE